jgi:hypothetical protein
VHIGLALAAAVHLSPRLVRERCLEDISALNVSRVAVLCDVMGVRRKNAFTPEVSAFTALADSPHRRG